MYSLTLTHFQHERAPRTTLGAELGEASISFPLRKATCSRQLRQQVVGVFERHTVRDLSELSMARLSVAPSAARPMLEGDPSAERIISLPGRKGKPLVGAPEDLPEGGH